MLRADPQLIGPAVEEFLRYDRPVKVNAAIRFAAAGRAHRRRGHRGRRSGLSSPTPRHDRDPAQFAAPDRLDIRRTDSSGHLAFSHGLHYCLGAPLARAEGQIAISALLGSCRDLALAVEPGVSSGLAPQPPRPQPAPPPGIAHSDARTAGASARKLRERRVRAPATRLRRRISRAPACEAARPRPIRARHRLAGRWQSTRRRTIPLPQHNFLRLTPSFANPHQRNQHAQRSRNRRSPEHAADSITREQDQRQQRTGNGSRRIHRTGSARKRTPAGSSARTRQPSRRVALPARPWQDDP